MICFSAGVLYTVSIIRAALQYIACRVPSKEDGSACFRSRLSPLALIFGRDPSDATPPSPPAGIDLDDSGRGGIDNIPPVIVSF